MSETYGRDIQFVQRVSPSEDELVQRNDTVTSPPRRAGLHAQPTLEVGSAHDPSEREADLIADQVVRRLSDDGHVVGTTVDSRSGRIRSGDLRSLPDQAAGPLAAPRIRRKEEPRSVQRLYTGTNGAAEARKRQAENKPKGYKSLGAQDKEYADPAYSPIKPEQPLAGGHEASKDTFEADLTEIYAMAKQSNLEFKKKVIAIAKATNGTPQFRSAQEPAAAVMDAESVGPQQKRQNAASDALLKQKATAAAALKEKSKIDDLDENVPVGLKGPDRAREKGMSDYQGKASGLVDILGGTIEYATFQDTVNGFKQCAIQGLKSIREKNRIAQPTSQGYRDIMLNVELSTGHIAELQFNLTGMLKAKSVGHKQYEEARSLEAYHKSFNIALDAENFAKLVKLYNEMRDIYGKAALASKMSPEDVATAFPLPKNS